MVFKRKRTYAPRRAAFKRRRFTKRRTSRRSRAVVGNQRPNPSYRPRSRRLSKRTFRSLLWKQTITQTKFKSTYGATGTLATPADATTATTLGAFGLSTTNPYEPFYTQPGGLRPLSGTIPSVAEPTEAEAKFNSDIIVRGGRMVLEVFNNTETADANNDIVRVKIVLLRAGEAWTDAFCTGNIGPSYTPRYIADFKRLAGYICLEKDFTLKDGESCAVEYKLKPMKIDVGSYSQTTPISGQYIWYMAVANGFGSDAQTCRYRRYYEVSFCGDASI